MILDPKEAISDLYETKRLVEELRKEKEDDNGEKIQRNSKV